MEQKLAGVPRRCGRLCLSLARTAADNLLEPCTLIAWGQPFTYQGDSRGSGDYSTIADGIIMLEMMSGASDNRVEFFKGVNNRTGRKDAVKILRTLERRIQIPATS